MLHALTIPARSGPAPHPTLVLLHGLGADENDLAPIAEALDPRLMTVLYRAPEPLSGYPGFQWFTILDRGRPEPSSWAESLAELKTALTQLRQNPDVDPDRIFLGGFSQGAVMSVGFVCRYPTLPLKAIILLSGYTPAELSIPDVTGLLAFVGHGLYDPVIPAVASEMTRDRLAQAGAQVVHRTYPIPHAIAPQEMTDLTSYLSALI